MTGLVDRMLALAQVSVRDPRQAVRVLLSLGIPLPARTAGLLLMAVASTILMQIGFFILPPGEDPTAVFLSQSPILTAGLQWVVLVVSVFLIHRIGRAWGGRGTLADTLLVVVWLQVMMLAVQALQLLLLLVVPPLSGLAGIGGMILFFWLMSGFVAELHGFASRGAVLAGILATGFALVLILVFLLFMVLGPESLASV